MKKRREGSDRETRATAGQDKVHGNGKGSQSSKPQRNLAIELEVPEAATTGQRQKKPKREGNEMLQNTSWTG